MRPRISLLVAALGAIVPLAGCHLHAFNNDTGGAVNLADAGEFLLVACGTAGIDVVRATTGDVVTHVDPGGASSSYDDIAVDDHVVLALDADDGLVTSFVLDADGNLTPVARDVEAPSGPYSGIDLAAGTAVVSGGTCGISQLSVDASGALAWKASFEVFRGQPDVTMLPLARGALLSTHFSGDTAELVDGQEFGVTTLAFNELRVIDTRGLDGAGFTAGGGRPSSWPVRAVIAGDRAFVAHGGGLDIFDLDASLHLARASHIKLPMTPVAVAVAGDEAFVAGAGPAQVVVVDIADPAAPKIARSLPVPGEDANPTAVVVTQSRIYVAANAVGLVVLDR